MTVSRRIAAVAAAVLAIGGAAFGITYASASTRPAPAPHMTCETVQMEVKTMGMPASYILVFCGHGIPAQTLICPRNSSRIPDTGERMICRVTR